MTVKTTVSLTDRHHSFAKEKAEAGEYATVSSVVAAGIEALMRDEEDRRLAMEAMREVIAERMKTPRSEWIEDIDALFEGIERDIDDKARQG